MGDHSLLESVGGDTDAYYDGFHVTRENARRILDVVLQEAPECLE